MTRPTGTLREPPQTIDDDIARAVAHHRAGQVTEAEAVYRAVLDAQPNHPGVLHNLGVIAAQRRDHDAALALFDRAIETRPDYADAHLNRAGVMQATGRLDDALAGYDRAIALRPDHPAPHNGRGDALRRLSRFNDAARCYERALVLDPRHYRARFSLGLALNALDRHDDALKQFEATLALRRGDAPIDPDHYAFRSATHAKLQHDIAQFRYLAARGIDPQRFDALARDYEAVANSIAWPADPAAQVPLPDALRAAIAATYNRPVHRDNAAETSGPAVNPALDTRSITRRYIDDAPGVAHFDNLLTPEALRALRRHLLESTVWFDFAHISGFVAAYLEDGLACPLLLQIAAELRRAFPDIIADTPLSQLWAFKCLDGDKGIDVHADAGKVSVNFWVTTDDANLAPDRGGLIVHRARPPAGWRLAGYDADIGRIRAFLAGAPPENARVVVPYRANRAVMFNSELFHESDAVAFRPGYPNHRINVTMLFGDRGG